jgi:hypothetical protein
VSAFFEMLEDVLELCGRLGPQPELTVSLLPVVPCLLALHFKLLEKYQHLLPVDDFAKSKVFLSALLLKETLKLLTTTLLSWVIVHPAFA